MPLPSVSKEHLEMIKKYFGSITKKYSCKCGGTIIVELRLDRYLYEACNKCGSKDAGLEAAFKFYDEQEVEK